MNVRDAHPADAEGITRARQEGWQSAYRGIMPDAVLDGMDPAVEVERWRERLANPSAGRCLLVVEEDGEVFGFCGGGACRDDDPEYDGELYALYIRPAQQRRGAGAALTRQMAAWLRQQGFHHMLIWVLRDNLRARRFYEAMGGAPVREREIEIGGVTLPEVGYGYDLRAPGTFLAPQESHE